MAMRLHCETHQDDNFQYGKSWDLTALEDGQIEFWGPWMQWRKHPNYRYLGPCTERDR